VANAGQAVIVLATGLPGAGKTTVCHSACELLVARTGRRAVHLEFDDFHHAVLGPAGADPSERETVAVRMAAAACIGVISDIGWLVLEGFFPRSRLEGLHGQLPVAATFWFEVPRDLCWERNQTREILDDRLTSEEVDTLLDRLDQDTQGWTPDLRRLDATLLASTLAELLADQLEDLRAAGAD
jgi:hypothetical protein